MYFIFHLDVYAGLGVAYSMKSQLETQLPTVPESLTSTDQCLLKSLVSTTAALSKVILPLMYNLMYVIFCYTVVCGR